MVLFLVYTKSQLLNSIVLSQTIYRQQDCDLYYKKDVLDGLDMDKVGDHFKNSYIMPVLQDRYRGRSMNRIVNAMRFKIVDGALPSDPRNYNEVFFAGKDYRVLEVYYALKRRNKSIRANLYEEGINEYYCYGKKMPMIERIYAKLFFGRYYLDDVEKLYVYKPEAVKSVYDFDIKKIPNPSMSGSTREIINSIFKYPTSGFGRTKLQIIFLDQIFDEYGYKKDYYDRFQEQILNRLWKDFGYENILIKLHPRSDKDKYGHDANYLNIDQPFEVLALNERLEDTVLVSICSSSVLNMKWIFGYEPYVITFNRVVIKDKRINAIFDFAQKDQIKKRFYMPSDLDGFERAIEEVKMSIV